MSSSCHIDQPPPGGESTTHVTKRISCRQLKRGKVNSSFFFSCLRLFSFAGRVGGRRIYYETAVDMCISHTECSTMHACKGGGLKIDAHILIQLEEVHGIRMTYGTGGRWIPLARSHQSRVYCARYASIK